MVFSQIIERRTRLPEVESRFAYPNTNVMIQHAQLYELLTRMNDRETLEFSGSPSDAVELLMDCIDHLKLVIQNSPLSGSDDPEDEMAIWLNRVTWLNDLYATGDLRDLGSTDSAETDDGSQEPAPFGQVVFDSAETDMTVRPDQTQVNDEPMNWGC